MRDRTLVERDPMQMVEDQIAIAQLRAIGAVVIAIIVSLVLGTRQRTAYESFATGSTALLLSTDSIIVSRGRPRHEGRWERGRAGRDQIGDEPQDGRQQPPQYRTRRMIVRARAQKVAAGGGRLAAMFLNVPTGEMFPMRVA